LGLSAIMNWQSMSERSGVWVDYEEWFSVKNDIGVICNNSYSLRFLSFKNVDIIKQLNKLILQLIE
jgi:hypothetical protein